ncbi:NAC domain-containing protein 13-like [Andrographis paniculata]|uniref:NAC domain-containing protein 13-like n=1 Tax=Andrographis paniculata TaxID=175694 RepID=UPI0021E899B6|nr:NAC domain-containing protein 13-like [Andrographis paniculata]
MCTLPVPPPPPEIDRHWTNEQLILLLDKYTKESNLPSNVLDDLSPYQHPPSVLPEGFWFIFPSHQKTKSDHGLWKPVGEPCKIYSNDSIMGWRITQEYFEGGERTDWIMQEYSVTRTDLGTDDATKDSRLLCRVFLSNGPHNAETDNESKEIDLLLESIIPDINNPSGHDPLAESKAMWGELPEVDGIEMSFSPQDSCDRDCIARGDFLELNDLVDPGSESSSSRNSSCASNLSEVYFDSLDLLREIEEDKNKFVGQQGKPSNLNLSVATSVDNVVLQRAPSGSRPSDAVIIEPVEGNQTGPDIESPINKTASKRSPSDGNETAIIEQKDANGAGPSGEKKAGSGRLKKIKLYFCFSF